MFDHCLVSVEEKGQTCNDHMQIKHKQDVNLHITWHFLSAPNRQDFPTNINLCPNGLLADMKIT